MPTDLAEAPQIETTTPTSADAPASNDAAAPVTETPAAPQADTGVVEVDHLGEPIVPEVEGADAAAAALAESANDPKAPAAGADPDADIKAMLRGTGKPAAPAAPKTDSGKEAAAPAATPAAPAKDGKEGAAAEPKPDPTAEALEGSTLTVDQELEAISKPLADEFGKDDAQRLFSPLLNTVKRLLTENAQFKATAEGFNSYQQQQDARDFMNECDRLADTGFKDLLGSTKDDSANMETRAQVFADAKAAYDVAQQKGKPITPARAVLFAVRLNAEGGKSPAVVQQQAAAQSRQARLSIAPKSTGGSPSRAAIDPNDPDAEARAAVRNSLRSLGR